MNNASEIILPGAFADAMPIRHDITILPAQPCPPGKERMGFIIFEEYGYSVPVIDKEIIQKLIEYMRNYVR